MPDQRQRSWRASKLQMGRRRQLFSPVQVDRGRRSADTSVSFSLASKSRFILRRDHVAVARESSFLYTDNVLVEARAESESNASFDRFAQCLWCIPTLK